MWPDHELGLAWEHGMGGVSWSRLLAGIGVFAFVLLLVGLFSDSNRGALLLQEHAASHAPAAHYRPAELVQQRDIADALQRIEVERALGPAARFAVAKLQAEVSHLRLRLKAQRETAENQNQQLVVVNDEESKIKQEVARLRAHVRTDEKDTDHTEIFEEHKLEALIHQDTSLEQELHAMRRQSTRATHLGSRAASQPAAPSRARTDGAPSSGATRRGSAATMTRAGLELKKAMARHRLLLKSSSIEQSLVARSAGPLFTHPIKSAHPASRSQHPAVREAHAAPASSAAVPSPAVAVRVGKVGHAGGTQTGGNKVAGTHVAAVSNGGSKVAGSAPSAAQPKHAHSMARGGTSANGDGSTHKPRHAHVEEMDPLAIISTALYTTQVAHLGHAEGV